MALDIAEQLEAVVCVGHRLLVRVHSRLLALLGEGPIGRQRLQLQVSLRGDKWRLRGVGRLGRQEGSDILH